MRQRKAFDCTPVMRVLRQMTDCTDGSGWALAEIDEGAQAVAYAVISRDRSPIWRNHRALVVKLFKPDAKLESGVLRAQPYALLNGEMVRGQFEALSRLYSAMEGLTIDGWKISVPEPLYVSESPLALVMTMVPGKNLMSWLRSGDDVSEVFDLAAGGIIAAMQKCWSLGQHHGDLTFDNILYDARSESEVRKLSFIDAGTLESCFVCNNAAKPWQASVCDLAHILSDIEAPMSSTIRNPISTSKIQSRKRIFIESLLRAFIKTIGPMEDKKRLLNEIRDCGEAHADNCFDKPFSLRRRWSEFRKHFASRRMNAIVDRLKAELDPAAV
jgi:hypothetical protein